MNDNLQISKEIFLKYLGCRENMKNDNCLDKYERYNVSEETEIGWKNEFVEEQFNKLGADVIKVTDFIDNVSFILSFYGDYADYKKLLTIIDEPNLKDEDLFLKYIYFSRVFDSISSNNILSGEHKLEILDKLDEKIMKTINRRHELPDKIYSKITHKYGLGSKDNYTSDKLNQIHKIIETVKESF